MPEKASLDEVAPAPSSSSSSGAAAAPSDSTPTEDPWEVNKPVERRSQVLTEELQDCLGCFWGWITCGGPGARVRQLYINGRLHRCMEEYYKFKNCMAAKLDAEKQVTVLPGPHPLWHIRRRKEANEFWTQNYAHLGARAANEGAAASVRAEQAGGVMLDQQQQQQQQQQHHEQQPIIS